MTTERDTRKPRRVSDDEVRQMIIDMCRDAGPDGNVRPEDVARRILPDHWQTLLKRIRITARQLAGPGYIEILRKGKVADPDDFRGLYRLRLGPTPLPEE